MTKILSFGHSNYDGPTFQNLVQKAGIQTVVDGRSSPASRYAHSNRTALETRLNVVGIAYVYLGVELGGRPRSGEPADFERMAQSPIFARRASTGSRKSHPGRGSRYDVRGTVAHTGAVDANKLQEAHVIALEAVKLLLRARLGLADQPFEEPEAST